MSKAKDYPERWRETVLRYKNAGQPFHPCRYCGMPVLGDEGSTFPCIGCWEVTSRLRDFLRDGGQKARDFVATELDQCR